MNPVESASVPQATPYSDLKIFRHASKLEAIREGRVTAPVYIRIKPINLCNHHCYYCSYLDENLNLRSTFRAQDQLNRSILMNLIEDCAAMGVRAVTFSGGGEPLMHRHIGEAMRAVLDGGMDLSLITNGHRLSGERAEILRHAKWVRVSMDSSRPERYAAIRRVPIKAFDQVCANVAAFAEQKDPTCELGVNFVITPENADEVYEMAGLVKRLGANHIKMSAVVTKDCEKVHESIRENAVRQIHRAIRDFQNERFRVINKYEFDFGLNLIFQRTYRRCPIQQIVTVVGADGKVYYCHDKAYVPGGAFGDLHKARFSEIWFSKETAQKFREFDARRNCCHHCVYDQRNILINHYLDLDDRHLNFI